jgi:hypothetical protein
MLELLNGKDGVFLEPGASVETVSVVRGGGHLIEDPALFGKVVAIFLLVRHDFA